MSHARGLLLLSVCLAVAGNAWALPDSARVARDVARVYNAPEGYEVMRLRRNDRVAIRGRVDRRRGSAGAVWVRIRADDGTGHRGWMRARDLSAEPTSTAREPRAERLDPDIGGSPRGGAARMLAAEAAQSDEVPIVDMDFACRRGRGGDHLAGCDLIMAFEIPMARLAPDALMAPVICEVAIRWTGVSGDEYRQHASGRHQVPTATGAVRSSMRLRYDFREPAVNALVDRQRCGLVRR